jgi:hypothetical protein
MWEWSFVSLLARDGALWEFGLDPQEPSLINCGSYLEFRDTLVSFLQED